MRCKTGCNTTRVRGGHRFAHTMKGKQPGSFLFDGGYAIEGLRPFGHTVQRGGFFGENQGNCVLHGTVADIPSGRCLQRQRYPADIDDTLLCPLPGLAGFVSAQPLPVNGSLVFN